MQALCSILTFLASSPLTIASYIMPMEIRVSRASAEDAKAACEVVLRASQVSGDHANRAEPAVPGAAGPAVKTAFEEPPAGQAWGPS
jgi:hypothetical protein